jgi:hypothetical protein
VTTRAHITVLVLSVATLLFILRLVRRDRLRAKYSVLWVSLGATLAIVAAAPVLLDGISDLLGIKTPVYTFLLMAITFLLVLSLHFSWELSRLEDRTRTLAEECALLREEVRRVRDSSPVDGPNPGVPPPEGPPRATS